MQSQIGEIFRSAQKMIEQSETGPGLFSSQDKSHCPDLLNTSLSSSHFHSCAARGLRTPCPLSW